MWSYKTNNYNMNKYEIFQIGVFVFLVIVAAKKYLIFLWFKMFFFALNSYQ